MEANTSKRRELLSGAQRGHLLALPAVLHELEERYSFTPSDLEFIGARDKRGLDGYAKQLAQPTPTSCRINVNRSMQAKIISAVSIPRIPTPNPPKYD